MAEEATGTTEQGTTEPEGQESQADQETGQQSNQAGAEKSGGEGESTGGEQGTVLDTGGQDAGDDAGEGGDDKTSEVPETYAEFKLPEGFELSEKALEKYTPVFKELGLSQEAAQKLVDAQVEALKAGQEDSADRFKGTVDKWLEDAKADEDIGGEKFDQNVDNAKHFLKEFGTPALADFLRQSGAGNHPEVIRIFAKAGKLLDEDNPGGGGPVNSPQDRVTQMYGENGGV